MAGSKLSPREMRRYSRQIMIPEIGVAEFDKVDEANLQRQVLCGSDDVGKLKSIIAKNRMLQLNSLADIEIFNNPFHVINIKKNL